MHPFFVYLAKEAPGLFNQKVTHHTHIFMFKIVAMIHKQAFKILEGFYDANLLAWHHQYGIFQAVFDEAITYSGIICLIISTDTAADNLELLSV